MNMLGSSLRENAPMMIVLGSSLQLLPGSHLSPAVCRRLPYPHSPLTLGVSRQP